MCIAELTLYLGSSGLCLLRILVCRRHPMKTLSIWSAPDENTWVVFHGTRLLLASVHINYPASDASDTRRVPLSPPFPSMSSQEGEMPKQRADNYYYSVCDGCDACLEECPVDGNGTQGCITALENTKSNGTDAEGVPITLETLTIMPGYWRSVAASWTILSCWNEEACLGGVTDNADFCESGYKGPCERGRIHDASWSLLPECVNHVGCFLSRKVPFCPVLLIMFTTNDISCSRADCAICADGYAATLAYTCSDCSSGGGVAFTVFALLAALAVVAAVIVYLVSTNDDTKTTRFRRLTHGLPVQGLKTVLVAWQILTQVGRYGLVLVITIVLVLHREWKWLRRASATNIPLWKGYRRVFWSCTPMQGVYYPGVAHRPQCSGSGNGGSCGSSTCTFMYSVKSGVRTVLYPALIYISYSRITPVRYQHGRCVGCDRSYAFRYGAHTQDHGWKDSCDRLRRSTNESTWVIGH